MTLSARNQLPGTVSSIKLGAVMAEVVVKLSGGEEMVAVITAESINSLGLKQGSPVKAVVKATEVMLATD